MPATKAQISSSKSQQTRLRAMRSYKKDFIYKNFRIVNEVLNRDVLADMLHTLLELEHKAPSIRSKQAHRIVSAIFSVIAKELRAGGEVNIPGVGTLKTVSRNFQVHFKKPLKHETNYIRRNVIRLRVSDMMHEMLRVDDFDYYGNQQ